MNDTHGSQNRGWIGVDLDGTLAHYDKWVGPWHIGEPVPLMVDRVKQWLAEGKDVRIFTARVSEDVRNDSEKMLVSLTIREWCVKHIGRALPITYKKDFSMIELWDDRAIQVTKNTGKRADGQT